MASTRYLMQCHRHITQRLQLNHHATVIARAWTCIAAQHSFMGQRQSRSHHGVAKFSVIIPTLNEASHVANSIDSANSHGSQVIVVDGGSTDTTCAVARKKRVKVLSSTSGRGHQLNVGWRASKGEWCIFLHGDSRLPPDYPRLIMSSLRAAQERHAGRRPLWGCFSTIQTEFGNTFHGKLLTWGVSLRTRLLHMPYGDQAIFVERGTLEALGGFKGWPLLEDVELVERLRRLSPPAIVEVPLATSGRRWEEKGFWKTCALNQAILLGYRCGVDVHTLANWYRTMKIGLDWPKC